MGDALTRHPPKTGSHGWEPQWLGDDKRSLYAALHRCPQPGARLGVVLVPPLFHEQPRSRRLLTEVANGLAALGLPALRFDFFGTADSAGDSEQTDFASMCVDLDLAVAALRTQAGVDRVAILAWRGAALPVARWLDSGGRPATVVLWEPIVDGAPWLEQLERDDAAERRSSERYPVSRTALGPDGQLMGLAVSSQLRADIAGARVADNGSSGYWAVLRPPGSPSGSPSVSPPELAWQQVFDLPVDAPTFDGSTRMDSGLFVTPRLKCVADDVGRALLERG